MGRWSWKPSFGAESYNPWGEGDVQGGWQGKEKEILPSEASWMAGDTQPEAGQLQQMWAVARLGWQEESFGKQVEGTQGVAHRTGCVMMGSQLPSPTLCPDALGAVPSAVWGSRDLSEAGPESVGTDEGVWNSNSRKSTLLENPASLHCLETRLWHQAKQLQPHLKCISHYLRPRRPDSPSHSALTCFQPASSSPSSKF